ncbi:MAG TPA: CocE/NonD family hydrolase, partial [Armatimonadota bacterium]|nr:CocE/NonD family hydrolase [Armatimonadota bacterium]
MTKLRGLIVLVLLSLVLLGAPGLAQDFEPGKNTVMVPMKDGVGLATDIWLPEGDGPWPVVMARTPYDKNPTAGGEFNANGMALVVQDVRGRFASEGEARPFVDDGWGKNRDGRDTAKWIVAQQWCNGEIATFGASALGMTQYLLAGNNPRGLVACYPVVACASMYHNGFYEGGAFRQALVEPWLEATGWPEYALEDSLSHPRYDALWKAIDLNTRARRVRVPMMHVGGWHDVFTQGTVDAFMALQYGGGKGARGRQHLIMGPWPHGIKTTKVGELAYPENAVWPEGAPEEMAWISAFLLSGGAGMDELPTVWYYVMGDVDAEDA